MNTRLLASLEDAMSKWAGNECESDDWISGYVGDNTNRLMALAAASVLDAVVDVQQYLKEDGYLSETY